MADSKPPPDPLAKFYRSRLTRNRIALAAAVAIAILLRVIGCPFDKSSRQEPGGEEDLSRYNNRTFSVTKVLDGDTMDVAIPDLKAKRSPAYTRVRLWGIDTPEISHFGKPAMHYGYEAAEFSRKLMAGKKIRLELIEGYTRDKFGRLLAYVYLPDGRMYNRLALDEGYAYAEVRFKHPLLKEFADREAATRQRLRGLWKSVTPDQLPHWYKPARLKSFFDQRRLKSEPISSSASPY